MSTNRDNVFDLDLQNYELYVFIVRVPNNSFIVFQPFNDCAAKRNDILTGQLKMLFSFLDYNGTKMYKHKSINNIMIIMLSCSAYMHVCMCE